MNPNNQKFMMDSIDSMLEKFENDWGPEKFREGFLADLRVLQAMLRMEPDSDRKIQALSNEVAGLRRHIQHRSRDDAGCPVCYGDIAS